MTLAVIVGVALLAPQGSSEPTRAQMAERLARVEPGMTLSEATAICGPAYTIGEIDGAPDGYIYVKYGALGPTSFPTYGFFKLTKDSRVEYVNGGLPTLIPEGLILESQVKELLTSIGGLNRPMTPRAAGKEFWP